MGRLYYGAQTEAVELDDRTLMHLQVVIISKLRRNEQFSFAWDRPITHGSGHQTLWLEPSIPLRFEYDRRTTGDFSREWVDQLMAQANGPQGLAIIPEPEHESESETAAKA